jgi:structural maintenance of chromosome 4
MDEIDAALDFRNVSIIANYIRERVCSSHCRCEIASLTPGSLQTKSAQFIIISLRSDMFELSHRLVGIYKTQNQTSAWPPSRSF